MFRLTTYRWFKVLCLTQVMAILISSFGIFISLHICQDKVQSIGVFHEASACTMEGCVSESVPSGSNHKLFKKSCCETIQCFFQQDIQSFENQTVTLSGKFQSAALVSDVQSMTAQRFCANPGLLLKNSDPPLPERDLVLLFGTFLI